MSDRKQIEVEGASFTVPARPSVMQMLHYRSMTATASSFLVGGWLGIRPMVADWESEVLPDYMADLSNLETDAPWAVTDVIMEAVLAVQAHLRSLDQEKN